MTPIRVRGKKQKLSGEPKMTKHDSTPQVGSNPAMSKPALKLSPLELLPTELLQEIFHQSLNLNLPRTSPTLGSILSSPHIKMQLVFKAFASGSDNYLEHSSQLLDALGTTEEVARLQSAILRLKWMTLDFVHQCIPIFLVKTLVQQFSKLGLYWRKPGKKVTEAAVTELVTDVQEETFIDSLGNGHLGVHYYNWEWYNHPHILLGIGLRDGLISLETTKTNEEELVHSHYRWRLLFCLDDCQIPEKLLRGPWTDEKCDFLEILTRGGARVGWIDTPSGEVAELGLIDALYERNQRAVEVLVKRPELPCRKQTRHDYVDSRCTFEKQSPNKGLCSPRGIAAESKVCRIMHPKTSVGVIPFTEHLRIAIVQLGFHKGIVKCLLSGDISRIDLEDNELSEWGLKKARSGDKHGKWFRRKLFALEDRMRYPNWNAGASTDAESTDSETSDADADTYDGDNGTDMSNEDGLDAIMDLHDGDKPGSEIKAAVTESLDEMGSSLSTKGLKEQSNDKDSVKSLEEEEEKG